jgi:rhodanese-related sulfurtransferase
MAGSQAGRTSARSYAGDIAPTEAWRLLESDPTAALIDVRTAPEWAFVGEPDLRSLGKPVIRVSWQTFPAMSVNASFEDEVEALGVATDAPVIFLCRSGARSKAAAIAMTERGFTRCYNLAGGFEGPLDAEGHRGAAGGWKAAGLPWRQS